MSPDLVEAASDGGETAVELSIVIPAWNEEDRLPPFLDSVLAFVDGYGGRSEVIVVDDGSTDRTSDVVLERTSRNAGLRLLVHEDNSGKGAAVRTGMLAAHGNRLLFVDADGATRMEELTRLEEALANGAQVAIGSREGDTLVECGPIRRFLGRWFNRAVRFGAVGGIRDTQCGFKLFDRPSALRLFGATQEDGYAFDVELLFLAQRWDIDVREIGVNWTEQAGSKVSLLPDGVRMLKAVQRIRSRWRAGEYENIEVRRVRNQEATPA